jgi:hypothetical protein
MVGVPASELLRHYNGFLGTNCSLVQLEVPRLPLPIPLGLSAAAPCRGYLDKATPLLALSIPPWFGFRFINS